MSVPGLFHTMLHVVSNDSEYEDNSNNNNTNKNAHVLNPYPPNCPIFVNSKIVIFTKKI